MTTQIGRRTFTKTVGIAAGAAAGGVSMSMPATADHTETLPTSEYIEMTGGKLHKDSEATFNAVYTPPELAEEDLASSSIIEQTGGRNVVGYDTSFIANYEPSGDWSETHDTTGDAATIHGNLAGSGTDADPYLISNDREFNSIRQDRSAVYKLTANIDLSGTQNWNGGDGIEPLANSGTRWTGMLRGDGYRIKGLYCNGSAWGSKIGIIGWVDNGNTDAASNLIIQDSTLTVSSSGQSSATVSLLGFCGGVDGIVAMNCEIIADNDAKHVGGLVGNTFAKDAVNNSAVIHSTITVESGVSVVNVGGVAGNAAGEYNNIISAVEIVNNGSATNVGGFGGSTGSPSYNAIYWNGDVIGGDYPDTSDGGGDQSAVSELSTSQMQGDSASSNMSGLDYSSTWETRSSDYPILQVASDPAAGVSVSYDWTVYDSAGSELATYSGESITHSIETHDDIDVEVAVSEDGTQADSDTLTLSAERFLYGYTITHTESGTDELNGQPDVASDASHVWADSGDYDVTLAVLREAVDGSTTEEASDTMTVAVDSSLTTPTPTPTETETDDGTDDGSTDDGGSDDGTGGTGGGGGFFDGGGGLQTVAVLVGGVAAAARTYMGLGGGGGDPR